MRLLITFLLFLFAFNWGYSQISPTDDFLPHVDGNLILVTGGSITAEMAKIDIEEGKAKIYIIGGIRPKIDPNQYLFEQKYGVRYFDVGCLAFDIKGMKAYNLEVFKYLDRRFPFQWRSQVRKEAVGL